MKEYPDHVQLRLRMTSEQINDANRRVKEVASYRRAEEAYRAVQHQVWKGVTHRRRTRTHWLYYAQQAREIAASKTHKGARRHWNRKAREYEEKAGGKEI